MVVKAPQFFLLQLNSFELIMSCNKVASFISKELREVHPSPVHLLDLATQKGPFHPATFCLR